MNAIYDLLLDALKNSNTVSLIMDNHGYFRDVKGYNIAFFPKNPGPGETYHVIGMTPGLNQTKEQIDRDIAKGRIMLVAEAINSSGAYVILEDDTGYMPISGNIHDDIMTFCRRVVKAIVYVTGTAESLGLTPHDYITKMEEP